MCFFLGFFQAFSQVEEDDDDYVEDNRRAKRERPLPPNERTSAPSSGEESKWIFGGDFGLSFGDFTFINLSPRVGYALNDNLILGATLRYTYYRLDIRNINGQILPSERIEQNWIGTGLFVQQVILENFFVGFEPEVIQINQLRPFRESVVVPFTLLGGGIFQRFNRSISFLGIYYNLTHDRFPITPSPIVMRVGFGF